MLASPGPAAREAIDTAHRVVFLAADREVLPVGALAVDLPAAAAAVIATALDGNRPGTGAPTAAAAAAGVGAVDADLEDLQGAAMMTAAAAAETTTATTRTSSTRTTTRTAPAAWRFGRRWRTRRWLGLWSPGCTRWWGSATRS